MLEYLINTRKIEEAIHAQIARVYYMYSHLCKDTYTNMPLSNFLIGIILLSNRSNIIRCFPLSLFLTNMICFF